MVQCRGCFTFMCSFKREFKLKMHIFRSNATKHLIATISLTNLYPIRNVTLESVPKSQNQQKTFPTSPSRSGFKVSGEHANLSAVVVM